MWPLHTDGGNSHLGGEYAKNVYLGETRIVTKLVSANEIRAWEEVKKIYFYHSDHLGSASLITDENGNKYQRLEYTPYGEVWVDKYSQIQESTALLPYKFTGKERDEETGLYYYGARYLDPKYSRWLSTDPALGEYIPSAPINDEAKKNNQNLPGMGGIFNPINFHLYHYAGNSPIRYVDPDGRQCVEGSCALAEDFSLIEATTTEVATTSSIKTISKLGVVGIILAFCFCLQGDSITPKEALPANYEYTEYGIKAPNGVMIGTEAQAVKHAQGASDWNKVDGWGKGTFETENDSLLYHFEKHGAEVGASTPDQYLNKAKGFKQNLKRSLGPYKSLNDFGDHTGWKFIKKDKFIILDLNKDKILSFGSIYHTDD